MNAVKYVASENVNRRHMSLAEKEYFYISMANAVGVQSRGGDRKSEYAKINVQNCAMVPPQHEHAASLGVHRNTVAKWGQSLSPTPVVC